MTDLDRTEAVDGLDRTEARRALEALRNGVPNADAVRALGCTQERAEAAFVEQLDQTRSADIQAGRAAGGRRVRGREIPSPRIPPRACSRRRVRVLEDRHQQRDTAV